MLGPFDNPSPGDVPLTRAPLVRVLGQVRFPQFSQFVGDDDQFARRFATAVASSYPLFEQGHETVLTITPEGVTSSPAGAKLWRLRSVDGTWQVSFAHNFLSIETSAYTKRGDFAARLQDAWGAFRAIAPPPYVERVGVRYVNRVADEALLQRLPALLRAEIAGVIAQPSEQASIMRAVSEALYELPEGASFLARWGLLPANVTLDPSIVPAPSPTWLLDLDSFRGWPPVAYAGDDIGKVSSDLALRAYQFFRWAVRPEFLTACGGELP